MAFETKTYSKHERDHTDVGWQTIALVRRDSGWKVSSVEDRDYIQPSFTDLSIDLHPHDHYMTAVARLALTVTEGGEDNIILSLNRGLDIDSITLADGKELAFERSNLETLLKDYQHESFTMADWYIPLGHLQLAKVYLNLGEEAKAKEHFEQVLDYPTVDSSHQEAKEGLQTQ